MHIVRLPHFAKSVNQRPHPTSRELQECRPLDKLVQCQGPRGCRVVDFSTNGNVLSPYMCPEPRIAHVPRLFLAASSDLAGRRGLEANRSPEVNQKLRDQRLIR